MTSSSPHQSVSVDLAGREYDIIIANGLLKDAGRIIAHHLPRRRTVIVTDENVAEHHAPPLAESLTQNDIVFEIITLPAGEKTKSFASLELLLGRLLDLGVERNDVIIALGGGVIGDLCGFAAAILRRGCRFIQIPTTLLAQVDSSVGGKTAINVPQGKNLVGAFHQPSLVLTDIDTLTTLSARQMRAGYAEVVKYGVIGDAPFFEWLEKNGGALLAGDKQAQIYAIKKSCESKATIVASDEREAGARALLNLGHTFGHALEGAYGYTDRLLHGEAVAIGMALALEYSVRIGLAPQNDSDRLKKHLRSVNLPAGLAELPTNETLDSSQLSDLMMQDKKVESGKLTLILASAIGGARIVSTIDRDDVQEFLKEKIAETKR